VTCVVLINLTPVQNYLAGRAAELLSRKMKTEVRVAHVRVDLLNHISLEGVYIGDQAHDTLLYAGEVQIRLTDWFLFKEKPVLHYLSLGNTYVHLYRTAASKDWNYDFLANAFVTTKKDKDTSTNNPIRFDLKKIELSNVRFHYDDKWGGEDQDYDIGTLQINADGIDYNKKMLQVNDIVAKNCNIIIKEYAAARPKWMRPPTVDTFDTTPFNPEKWAANVKSVSVEGCEFHLVMNDKKPVPGEFDYNHIDATKVKAYVTNGTIRGDTIRGTVEHFEVKERCGVAIRNMRSKVTVSPIASICDNLFLETNYSTLHDKYAMHYKHFPDFINYIDSVTMSGNLNNSIVDIRDIAYFAPELKAFPPIVLHVSGDGGGTVSNLHAQHINVSDGNTVVKGTLTMKGLPDIYKTYITYSDGELFTTNAGIIRYAPALKTNPNINMSSIVYAYFKGRYEGYVQNFAVNGVITTNLGSIGANIKMNIPGFVGSNAVYSGHISSDQVQLGTFFKQPLLGSITFNEDISGASFNPEKVQMNIDGTIKEFIINNYAYHNIITHGTLAKKQFNGTLMVDDPNLALEFDGGINYGNKNVNINATAHMLGCNFKALNILKDSVTGSADFDLNCTGSNIDNFSGYAKLNNINMKRNSRKLAIDSVFLNATGENDHKSLTIQSDDLVASITGNYQLSNLPASVQYYLSRYIPNYISTPAKFAPEQNFKFTVTTRNIDSILAVTTPFIRGFDSSTVSGSLNTSAQKVTLMASIPNGSIGKFHMNNVAVNGQGNLDAISLSTTIDNVVIGDSSLSGSLSLTAALANDSVSFTIATTTPDPSSSIALNGQIIARKDSLFLNILPSQFFLNQVKWDIAGGSKIVYSDKYLSVAGLSLTSGLQKISASTELQNQDKTLIISTENLDLGQFGSWAGFAAYQPDGRVNGTIQINKLFQDLYVSANLKATGVLLGTDTLGTVNFIGDYDGAKKLYSLDPQTGIYRDNASLTASGNISFDSATNQKLDGAIQFNNAPVAWSSTFLMGIMSRLSGTLNGSINFGGSAYAPVIKGEVALHNAGFRVDYLGCNYTIPTADIHVDNRTISYGSVTVLDNYKNPATLTGHFSHNMFRDMRMHLSVKSKKFEVINLTNNDNNLFYGNIIASMDSFTIKGPFNYVRLNIYNAAPAAKSRIYIPLITGGDVGTYNYVSFKKYGKDQEKVTRKTPFKIDVNIDANLNTLAEMHIVLDPSTGDEIMARGDGRIQLDIPWDNDIHTTGLYNIDNGAYTLTFKSLFIHRIFKLNSGVISFNGPFSETSLNVDAVYTAKAKLADLLNETDLRSLSDNEVKDAQTPQWVNVSLNMSGQLKSPKLTFDLDLEDKHSQSTFAYHKLMLINADDRQKTEEVFSLLLISSFIPPEGIGSGTVATGTLNNISQVISSSASTGLTNIASKITGDKQLNIDVKYTNYNYNDQALGGINRNQVKVAASKNYFNDKLELEVGGTSDWGRPTSAASTSTINITGDFRLQYRLSYASGLRLDCFRTSDYDVTIDRDIIRSGVGISWRKSFDNFSDFFRSNQYMARKKQQEENKTPDPADTTAKQAASGTE